VLLLGTAFLLLAVCRAQLTLAQETKQKQSQADRFHMKREDAEAVVGMGGRGALPSRHVAVVNKVMTSASLPGGNPTIRGAEIAPGTRCAGS
jgi:hypothetical protein